MENYRFLNLNQTAQSAPGLGSSSDNSTTQGESVFQKQKVVILTVTIMGALPILIALGYLLSKGWKVLKNKIKNIQANKKSNTVVSMNVQTTNVDTTLRT